jgi:AcrR family transcriptional regulator
MPASPTTRELDRSVPQDSRFDRRLGEILAGLYYYFESKEKLLYFIQQHTFNTIMETLRQRLATSKDPENRIRIFVDNHVDYSVAKQKAMKVLSHEDDVLKNGYGAELAATKREYYRICVELVDEFAKAEGLKSIGVDTVAIGGINTRTAVMGLFGMMNWLYTWYKPGVDPEAEVLAREISDIFLSGIRSGAVPVPKAVHHSSNYRDGKKTVRRKR